MASNTSRPEGLRKIGSTSHDTGDRVSLVQYVDISRGIATFRALEAGSGVTFELIDADFSPTTIGQVVKISATGGGTGGAGTAWFNGAALPSVSLGSDGDYYLRTNGDYYEKVSGSWNLLGSLMGPQGPAGATGAQGPIGPQGAAGVDGAAGATGPAGADGANGLSAYDIAVADGFVGDENAWLASLVGPQGPQGVQGIQGIQGPIGPAGADGAAGPQGPQGPAGADGTGIAILGSLADEADLPATGNTISDAYLINGDLFVWTGSAWENVGPIQGPAGPQGIQGVQGPIGPQGPAGADGAAGPQGIQGIQGETGPQGPIGLTGPQGPKGDTGDTGATGAQGPIGPEGPQGIQGIQGPVGPAGADGATGPQGPKGDTGEGVPTGGTTGQVLAKVDGTDYNTEWVDSTTGLTSVATDNTATALVYGLGTTANTLKVDVRISTDPTNAIAVHPGPTGGLFVATGGGATVDVTDSTTLDFSGDGSVGSPITASAKISTETDNMLEVGVAGLYVSNPLPVGGSTGQVLAKVDGTDYNTAWVNAASGGSYTVSDTSTVDMVLSGSDISANVKLSATAGNAITTNADGIYVATPATGLTSVTSSDTSTIDFSGAGTAGSPLTADVKISSTAGNAITSNATGLFVATPTAYTVGDTNSVDLTLTGSNITADVKRSATANNKITEQADGLFVAPVAVQDEGTAVVANPTAINFTGAGVTTTNVGGVATVNIPGGGGSTSGITTYSVVVQYTSTASFNIISTPAGWTAIDDGGTILITHDTGKKVIAVVARNTQSIGTKTVRNMLTGTAVVLENTASEFEFNAIPGQSGGTNGQQTEFVISMI